jgi:hypothetical protein
MGWPMDFQHANDITHVEEPSLATVWKMFQVKYFVVVNSQKRTSIFEGNMPNLVGKF